MKVSIIGGTGYSGLELIRLLHNHPCVDKIDLFTSQKERQETATVYPHLSGIISEFYEVLDYTLLNESSDVIFLATPNGVSKELVTKLNRGHSLVIDLSGDLRLKDRGSYEKYYKSAAAAEILVEEAVYGLSETNRELIKQAKLISNPGCFPTAVLLGLAPLLTSSYQEKAHHIFIDAKTGITGAGKGLTNSSHFSQCDENLTLYKVHEHQHIPEIEQGIDMISRSNPLVTFTTTLVPLLRGIMATMYVPISGLVNEKEIYDAYKAFAAKEAFVRIRPYGVFPSVKEVRGSNYCDIGMKWDERTKTLCLSAVIDNLVKGAAGQAVQNMNIALGIEESAGLQAIPLFP